MWALCLAAGAPAQNVWVVDAAMGAGAHTRDIRLALLMAADGDRILVRRGVYGSTVIQARSVTIVGEPGAEVRAGANEVGFAVMDLAAHQAVSIRGFTLRSRQSRGDMGVYVRDNLGALHLESLDIEGMTHGAMQVETSRAVDLVDVHMRGGAVCCSLWRSNVAMSRCTAMAADGRYDPGCGAGESRLSILDCVFKSGNLPLAQSEVGLVLANCNAVIAGNTTIAAGRSSRPVAALGVQGGSVELDAGVVLLPQRGAAGYTSQQGARVAVRAVPTLQFEAPGKCVLRGASGSATATLASPQVTPVDTAAGTLFCGAGSSLVVDAGVLRGAARSFALPAARATLGSPLLLQSVLLEASGAWRLTPALPFTY